MDLESRKADKDARLSEKSDDDVALSCLCDTRIALRLRDSSFEIRALRNRALSMQIYRRNMLEPFRAIGHSSG